jgi:hypothetical protein
MKTSQRGTMADKALAALDEAVAGVVERHRKDGRRMAIWRKGKVVRITAEEALRLRARHAACTGS